MPILPTKPARPFDESQPRDRMPLSLPATPEAPPAEPEVEPETPEAPPKEQPGLDPFEPSWPPGRIEPQPKASE